MSNFLSKTFIDSNLSDTVFEILDLGTTTFTGVPIPIVSGLKSLYKTSQELKEKLFYQKLFEFLNEVKDIPQNERIDFHDKISKKGDDVWEKALVLLHDLDNTKKAKICGALFKNAVLNNIDYDDVERLSYVVNVLYYDDIEYFFDIKNNAKLLKQDGRLFKYINLGLVEDDIYYHDSMQKTNGYKISRLGNNFIKFSN